MPLFDDIEQARKELEKLRVQYNDLTSEPAPIFEIKNLDDANAAVETMRKTVKQTHKEIEELEKGFGGVYDQVRAIVSELYKQGTPTKDITKQFRNQEKILLKLKNEQQGFGDLNLEELKVLKEKQNVSAQNIRDKAQEVIAANRLKSFSGKELETRIKDKLNRGKISEEEAAIVRGAKEGFKVLTAANEKIEERIRKEKRINEALGLGGNIIKGVGKGLDKIGMGGLAKQLGLDKAQEEMKRVSKELTDGGKKTADFATKSEVLRAGFESMRGSLLKNLTDPLSIGLFLFNSLFKAAQKVDKQTGELAKNLNMSYGDGLKLQNELTTAANSAGGLSVSSKALGNSLMAVNKELGISNTNIDDNLLLFTKLHKSSGLTYEELQGINAITNATGGDLEKNTKEVMAQARLTGQRFKVALNEKDILKDISNVSKATTISLGKNPTLIAQAVSTAKALGLELSKVEGVADSLLNFEESISKELQAELLLGKNINLEKAREAALNNDLATVAEEIAQQAGNAAEFAEMNRIQQQALADAVGLSREELANSLFIQDQIGNLTGEEYELRKAQIEKLEAKGLSQAQIKEKLGKESISDLKAQNSISEQIAKSTDKLNDAFAGIAIPLMQIITPIIELLIPAIQSIAFLLTPVFDIFNGIAGILTGNISDLGTMETILGSIALIAAGYYATTKGIAMYNGFIKGYKIAQVALERANKAGILGTIGALTVQLGIQLGLLSASLATNAAVTFGVGVAIAVAAAAAGYAAIKAMTGDDVYSPGSNSSGYGSRTLLGPEGAIALNNKDTVIAGTKLFDKGDDVISKGAGEVQMPTQDNRTGERTNTLLETLIGQNSKKPELSPVNMYEIQ
jgi:hypothetical protein